MEWLADTIETARLENLESLMQFISKCAGEAGFVREKISEIEIAAEEAFVNVMNYAYKETNGKIWVRWGHETDDRFVIEIADSGVPFDFLAASAKDPDTSSDIAHRTIGGLGIFLIKKLMDEIRYAYADGKNILTLVVKKSPSV